MVFDCTINFSNTLFTFKISSEPVVPITSTMLLLHLLRKETRLHKYPQMKRLVELEVPLNKLKIYFSSCFSGNEQSY